MTERQKFDLVRSFKQFELRRYVPCVVAEVEMSTDFKSAANGAFRYLFNYISKGNESSTSIPMTAPVIAATQSSIESEKWKISFVMPAGSKLDELPRPLDNKVKMVALGAQDCVSISFRGRATDQHVERYEKRLRELAENEGIELSEETRINRFDPPFKPGFLQYNEVVIPLKNG